MDSNQIERLKKDSRNLGHYIHKLNKKGKQETAYRLAKKQAFLEAAISQVLRG
jgi:hypothetical protein